MTIVSQTAPRRQEIALFPARSIFTGIARLKDLRAEMQMRRHYRRELRRLLRVGPHMIEDLGLALDEAQREAAKPFWLT